MGSGIGKSSTVEDIYKLSVGRDDHYKLDLSDPVAARPDIILSKKDVETKTLGKDVCRVVIKDEQTGKEAIFFLSVAIAAGRAKAKLIAKTGNGEAVATARASWLPPVKRP